FQATRTTPLPACFRPPVRTALLTTTFLIAQASAVFAAWMIPPSPYRPKDFTLVKRDGTYHLFYIRTNPTAPPESTQVDFGHATSKDLYFWTQEPTVLPIRPGLFDRSHVWAPSIVMADSVYFMFYTGVSDTVMLSVPPDSTTAPDTLGVHSLYQQIGIATSVDLETWNRLDDPVFNFTMVPWATGDSTNAAPFRDPFVMADPDVPNRWLMTYSTAPASDPEGMIAGLAVAPDDLTPSQRLKPLWITQRGLTFNERVESPHLFRHGGLWYLFFTTAAGQPISFATTSNLYAPPAEWTYRGRLANTVNANTAAWYASEYFRDGL